VLLPHPSQLSSGVRLAAQRHVLPQFGGGQRVQSQPAMLLHRLRLKPIQQAIRRKHFRIVKITKAAASYQVDEVIGHKLDAGLAACPRPHGWAPLRCP
jgi:hypothetical protein